LSCECDRDSNRSVLGEWKSSGDLDFCSILQNSDEICPRRECLKGYTIAI